MKEIKPSISTVSSFIGIPEHKDDVDYRLTKNHLSVPCEGGTLLYNTLTGALFLLEENETIEDYFSEFVKEGFYIPVMSDEQKLADDVLNVAKVIQTKKKVKDAFTILTTTDCNARCFYCYEMGRSRIPMSETTAADVAEYIIKSCEGKKVSLHWFGGEPLYNKAPIDIITRTLREKGIPFHSRMTSNGYYLDEETCRTAKEKWALDWVQITLDGTKERYQKAKAYIEKDPDAFERVLSNIKHALEEGIYVAVRLNVDHENVKDMHKLVDLLSEEFKGYSNFHVYAALLHQFEGKIHSFESEVQELEEYEELLERIDEYGIGETSYLDKELKITMCMADSDRSEVILPDGRIGKCEHFTESELVGSIYSDDWDEEMLQAWKELSPKKDECGDCPVYPLCRRLVKCVYTENRCRPSYRMLQEHILMKKMISEYKRYKEKGDGKDEA